ncbi:MAG: autotransporter outer membrane beta-barrel domain-containing protein [Betaproteobacteria bacterium]|nr:autotransporter outer membrane beta-barrel domain-containing protein [Betaproteobacteria bacterium]
MTQPAVAQTSVPDGTNLGTLTAPTAGTVWNLQGNATLFSPNTTPNVNYGRTLPTGATGLTINGVASGSTVTLNDGAGHYGYMYSTSATTLSLSNVTFTGGRNTDTGGAGGSYSTSAGGIIYNNGGLTLNTSGAVAFENSTVPGAPGTAIGGALYTNGVMTLNVTGSLAISGNSSSGFGGGAYALQGLAINNTGQAAVNITNNQSLTYGGGGLNTGNYVSIMGGANISGNTAVEDGGGIRTVPNPNTSYVSIGTGSGDVTLNGNSAGTGAVGYNGGGIAVYSSGAAGSGNATLGNSAGTVTITGNTAGYTTATSGVVANTGSNGGGIYAEGVTTLTGSAITLSNNLATANGGGIYSGNGVVMSGPLTANGNVALHGSGGAIYANSGGVAVTGSLTADNNTAGGAGGAVFSNAGNVAVSGSVSLDGNHANGGAGGAINAASGTVSLATAWGNALLTSNTASTTGGAVSASGNVTIGNTAGTVSIGVDALGGAAGNTASTNGGGIYAGGSVTLTGTQITLSNNNATTGNGGAIYAGGNVTLDSSGAVLLENNVAYANSTGAIDSSLFGGGAISSGGTVTINGSDLTLNNNSATTGNGGVIYAAGDVTLTATGDVSLTGNTSLRSGSTIRSGETISITGRSITLDNNQSSGANYGGSISALGDIIISGNFEASNNRANAGGALYAGLYGTAYGGNVSIEGDTLSLTYNSASGRGGAIRDAWGGDSTKGNVALGTGMASSVSLSHNTGGLDGGAIAADSSVTIGNSNATLDIEYNTSTTANGGAIWAGSENTVSSGGVTLTGSAITLSHNTASGSGGGIYSGQSVTVNGDLTVDNNTATNGNGGAINAQVGGITINASLEASGNIAHLSGGALYAINGDVTVTGATSLSGNAASGGVGGAIAVSNSNVTLANNSGNVTLAGNTALSEGGAIYNAGSSGGVVAIGNSASTVNIKNNVVGYNSSGNSWGGAIAADANGSVTVTGGAITLAGNQVSSSGQSSGGAIYLAGGPVTLSGGTITLSGNQSNSTGNNSFGGAISSGFTGAVGTVTIAGGAIALTGNRASGAQAFGGAIYANGSVTLTGSTITLSDNRTSSTGSGFSYGGAISAGTTAHTGPVTITGDTITLSDNQANNMGSGYSVGGGIYTNGPFTMTGTTITLSNNQANSGSGGSWGGAISAGGAVTLAGGTITLSGNQASSTSSSGGGGAINNQSGGITVNGSLTANANTAAGNGGALYAQSGDIASDNGDLSLDSNHADGGSGGAINAALGNVSLASAWGNALLANNMASGDGGAVSAGNDISLGNTAGGMLSITGNSAGGNGGALFSGAATTLTGTTLSNNSAGGDGGAVYATTDFTLTATSADTLSNNSAGGRGGAIWAGGNVTLNATYGNITFAGNMQGTAGTPQANAIYLNNTSGATVATFDTAANRAITFFDPIQSNAVNGLVTVNKTGAGTLVFDGSRQTSATNQWSQVYGNTEVQSGTFVIDNKAVYGVLAADVGQTAPSGFTVAAGTTLAGGVIGSVRADNFTLGGTLDIAGAQPGTVGNLFTVVSNKVSFAAGSQVRFNTMLNDGSVQQTDRLTLTLNGNATSGTAGVRVNNVGGAGALTAGNGIELVQVTDNNGTTEGAFALSKPAIAGPYEYTLFHGSVDASGPQNWYLRSTLNCSLAPDAEVCAQPPGPTPPAPPPDYRIETSLNAALPSMALLYGRKLIDTLHERIGEEEDIRGRADLHQRVPNTGGWVRLIGMRGRENGDPLGIYGSGPGYNYSFIGLQGGTDLLRREDDDGNRDHLGVMFAVGNADGTVTHFDGRTGSSGFQGYSLGGYWTHFGAPGWYLDTVVQGTHYDARTDAERGLLPFKTRGNGIAGSLEGGYPIKFENGYFIEPQAQLIYQRINFNDALDNGALVKFNDVQSLAGRIGARFGRTWSLAGDTSDRRKLTAWLRPNIWREFLGNPLTQFSSETGFVPFRAELRGAWWEINSGVSGQVNRSTSLYANVSYNQRFDRNGHGYDGKLGVRVNW